ncbi:hypothetical protein CAEBREN_08645 [Caenorhabditis brenneri]|uniref:Uncharacterized protein n=1 Tax=Caenorhabditis brenneri TaxID=135651 RepID=G0MCW1_CAEBE|nr:hypothetical protein CAEBREN_08645 [Caenorhabditis brenneri]
MSEDAKKSMMVSVFQAGLSLGEEFGLGMEKIN